ncbi:MAG: hypothetical protein C4576_31690 [Desulfobacteraceae bacterium]|nr:MAG: hypothetical protein C4576_31690 [Desulfobacteraceae bacterium]
MNMEPEEVVILYTFFAPHIDITKEEAKRLLLTTPELRKKAIEQKEVLGWDLSLVAFPDLEDITHGCLDVSFADNLVAWILRVPADEIRWAAFKMQIQKKGSFAETFFSDQETIRHLPDIPCAYVRIPIRPEWVLRTAYPAKSLLAGRGSA